MTQGKVNDGELKEKLAAIEHERWADWQKYMHSKFVEHENGKGEWVCLPAELFKRWERQIATKYADLPASEKQSDRDQVDRYWPLIESLLARRVIQELEMALNQRIYQGISANPKYAIPVDYVKDRIAELSQRGREGTEE